MKLLPGDLISDKGLDDDSNEEDDDGEHESDLFKVRSVSVKVCARVFILTVNSAIHRSFS